MTEVKVGVIVEGGPGAPVASVSLTEMTVIEGHTVSMQCQASGKIDPLVNYNVICTVSIKTFDSKYLNDT